MSAMTIVLICIVFLVVTLMFILAFVSLLDKKHVKAWAEFAKRHHLKHDARNHIVEGNLNGRSFKLDKYYYKGSGRGIMVRMTVSVSSAIPIDFFVVNKLSEGLLESQDLLGIFKKPIHKQVVIDGSEFNKKLVLACSDEPVTQRFFSQENQKSILDVFGISSLSGIQAQTDKVVFHLRGLQSILCSPEELEIASSKACGLARAFES